MVLVISFLTVLFGNSFGEDGSKFEVGCNTFGDVVKSSAFVDKSLMIKDFFNYKLVLITAPRGFGKSINMDMIWSFCEIKVFTNGSIIPKTETDVYKIFSKTYLKTTNCLEHLDVFKNIAFFTEHFSQYPVIYLDFKKLRSISYSEFINGFLIMLSDEFRRHDYLLYSDNLSITQNAHLNTFYDMINRRSLIINDLLNGLVFLSEVLYTRFNKRVVVLIDELDGPVQNIIFKPGNDVDSIIDFIQAFINNLLKSNKYVERALLNVCVRPAGSVSIDANNIKQYPFLANHSFNTYFGLTQEEVSKLLVKFKLENHTVDVMEWYDGYFLASKNIKMYSTWSIINYLESRQLKSYWIDSGYIKNFRILLFFDKIRVKILELLDSKTVQITFVKNVEIEHIISLIKIIQCRFQWLTDSETDLFLQFITENGYFDIIRLSSFDRRNKIKSAYIKIPNNEIFSELTANVYEQELFKLRFNFEPVDKEAFKDAVLSLGNASSFKQLLEKLNRLFRNQNTLPINQAELAHTIYSSLKEYDCFALLDSELPLRLNTGGGKPSADIIVARHDGVGIIMELNRQTLNVHHKASAITALNQSITYYKLLDQGNYKKLVTNDKILIGVYMTITGKFSICYLVNNLGLGNKTCLFSK